jgi:hypothetical protein
MTLGLSKYSGKGIQPPLTTVYSEMWNHVCGEEPLNHQVGLPDILVGHQTAGRVGEDGLAILHDVAPLGHFQGQVGILLHQKNHAYLLSINFIYDIENLPHHERGKPRESSSSSNSRGRAINARDMANICCSPPLGTPTA